MVIVHYFYPCLHRKLGGKGKAKRCGKIKFGKGVTVVVDKSIVCRTVIIIKEIDSIKKAIHCLQGQKKGTLTEGPHLSKLPRQIHCKIFHPKEQCLKR